MKKKNYDEVSVIRSITKKADVSVDYVNKIIQVKEDSNEVGNGTWGKIDYLCHYCGYIYVRPKTINNRKIINREFGDDNDRKTSKKERKQLKLDMVKSTKKLMKK
ncbi:hypothetical protein [Paraprevotella clara]|uniref:hypothetical protein n=1 Tax=Paraprevotella clara TaxID=454154 RepID=UPI00266FE16B|nr:hypothetical protein [Paraprevotella clara]